MATNTFSAAPLCHLIQVVVSDGAEGKMVNSHTTGRIAGVHYHHSDRDGAMRVFVDEAMRLDRLRSSSCFSRYGEVSVSGRQLPTRPEPAITAGIDELPKSVDRTGCSRCVTTGFRAGGVPPMSWLKCNTAVRAVPHRDTSDIYLAFAGTEARKGNAGVNARRSERLLTPLAGQRDILGVHDDLLRRCAAPQTVAAVLGRLAAHIHCTSFAGKGAM